MDDGSEREGEVARGGAAAGDVDLLQHPGPVGHAVAIERFDRGLVPAGNEIVDLVAAIAPGPGDAVRPAVEADQADLGGDRRAGPRDVAGHATEALELDVDRAFVGDR